VTSSQSLVLLVALLVGGAALSQARATPLDADACNKAMIEHGVLEEAGVEQNMAKGPEWAKANLSPERIEQVRRFIELEEVIQFRCRSKSRVTLPPDPDDKDKDQDKGQDKGKDQAKAGQDKSTGGKESPDSAAPKTPAPFKAKAPGPAAKAKGNPKDSKAQPKVLPEKQPSPVPKAKSAAQQPKSGTSTRRKRPPKAKVEKAPETASSPPGDNPLGEPFAGTPQ
jgi:hypothetical protein